MACEVSPDVHSRINFVGRPTLQMVVATVDKCIIAISIIAIGIAVVASVILEFVEHLSNVYLTLGSYLEVR